MGPWDWLSPHYRAIGAYNKDFIFKLFRDGRLTLWIFTLWLFNFSWTYLPNRVFLLHPSPNSPWWFSSSQVLQCSDSFCCSSLATQVRCITLDICLFLLTTLLFSATGSSHFIPPPCTISSF